MSKELTALEWYVIKDTELTISFLEGKINKIKFSMEKVMLFEQAKKIQKEQSQKDYEKGQESMQFKFPLSPDNYYEETYKGGQDV